MKTIKIDRAKHLCDEPATGHNRWHPDLEPILETGLTVQVPLFVEEGDVLRIDRKEEKYLSRVNL